MAKGRQTLEQELEGLEKNHPKVKAAARGLEEVTSKFSGRNFLFGPNYYLPIDEWKFPKEHHDIAELCTDEFCGLPHDPRASNKYLTEEFWSDR